MVLSLSKTNIFTRFLRMMDILGPFEEAPHIAIAVSGGGDSSALTYLAIEWVKFVGGKITALTVDHGLRSESRSEAQSVGGWVNDLGIQHQILNWEGHKPTSQIQASAREARYRLMDDWCKENAVLHLLLAHTQNDQAETFLMRKDHGSGPVGLAAMSQVIELTNCRILRPLLAETNADLRLLLKKQKAEWIEDPSNQDDKYERVRIRLRIQNEKISCSEMAMVAAKFGTIRLHKSKELSAFIARTVYLSPFGFAHLDLSRTPNVSDDLVLRLFARLLTTIGGRTYSPSKSQLGTGLKELLGKKVSSVTCSGCQIIRKTGGYLIVREQRGLPMPIRVQSGQIIHWDHRFRMKFGPALSMCKGNAVVRSLKDVDWAEIKLLTDGVKLAKVSAVIRRSLPVICDDYGVFCVPHLGVLRSEFVSDLGDSGDVLTYLLFCPLNSMSDMGFSVASPMKPTISVL
jgi:tRNA(Ile)-lysidine synthase